MGNTTVSLKITNNTNWGIVALTIDGSKTFTDQNAHKFNTTTIPAKHSHNVNFTYTSTDRKPTIIRMLFTTDEIDELHFKTGEFLNPIQKTKSHRITCAQLHTGYELTVENTQAHALIATAIDAIAVEALNSAEIALQAALACTQTASTRALAEKTIAHLANVKADLKMARSQLKLDAGRRAAAEGERRAGEMLEKAIGSRRQVDYEAVRGLYEDLHRIYTEIADIINGNRNFQLYQTKNFNALKFVQTSLETLQRKF